MYTGQCSEYDLGAAATGAPAFIRIRPSSIILGWHKKSCPGALPVPQDSGGTETAPGDFLVTERITEQRSCALVKYGKIRLLNFPVHLLRSGNQASGIPKVKQANSSALSQK